MNNAMPHVTIIMLNWNQEADTMECLASVSRLAYPDFSVVIVDNGSTDGSVDVIADWAASDQRFTVVRNSENLGFIGGSNIGLRMAIDEDTDYILLLNNDTVVTPDFLSSLVNASEGSESIGITGPKVYQYGEDRVLDSAGTGAVIWLAQGLLRGHGETDCGQYDSQEEMPYITGCALLMKRSVLAEIGLMDEDYFNYFDDLDWGYRARLAGYRLVYVPSSTIEHKGSQAIGLGSPFYFHHMTRSRILFARKHVGWLLFLLCFIPYLLLYRYLLPVLKFLRHRHWGHLRALNRGVIEGFSLKLTDNPDSLRL